RQGDGRNHAQVPHRPDGRVRGLDQARQAAGRLERETMSYKLLSFKSGAEARAGLLVDGKVYDAPGWTSVLDALQDWPRGHREFAAFGKRIESGKSKAKGAPLARVRLLAPVLYPGNIYCAGANYTDHMAEMARAQGKEPGPTMKDLGEKPWH